MCDTTKKLVELIAKMSKYDECAADFARYLFSKLPSMDEATAMEVAEYITHRCKRLIDSQIEDVYRDCRQAMKSQQRYFNKELDRLRRRDRMS